MKLITFLLTMIAALAGSIQAQAFKPVAENSNYVVIGAFAIEEHAEQFVASAKRLELNPVAAINKNRHLFYVYVLQTEDRTAAFREATRIRKATPFMDTWVYSGPLGGIDAIAQIETNMDGKPSTITGPNTTGNTPVTVNEKNESTLNSTVVESAATGTAISNVSATDTPVSTSVTSSSSPATIEDAEAGGKNFLFRIFTTGDKELIGDVDLIDTEKSRRLASYTGNKNVVVQRINRTGKMSFMCEVFGYRKLQKDLNFDHPEETEGVVVEGNQTQVPFELARLQKGDIAVMYNVYFYKDAAIMRPESKYEVTSLLDMMKENPKYRIKIHGHTNGGAPGKIISMGNTKNFFSMTDTSEGVGTAKKLSEDRAEVIRAYLLEEGIDGKRMEVKAWGGKRPVYDKNGPMAASNVRVEIEILDDK